MKTRVLIKIGGRAFSEERGFKELSEAIKKSKHVDFIIVHGGGSEISQALKEANLSTEFIDGIRVTGAKDIKIIEDVLSNRVNKRITTNFTASGILCRRLSGKTENLLIAEPLRKKGKDYGYVGKVKKVNPEAIINAFSKGQLPVVSPISANEKGMTFNVNADNAAAALAIGADCSDLIFFSDVPGVLVKGTVISDLPIKEARSLIEQGHIKGGMVAKLESAFYALNKSVPRVHITQWSGPETLERIVKKNGMPGTTIRS